jgi:hypothetical protein
MVIWVKRGVVISNQQVRVPKGLNQTQTKRNSHQTVIKKEEWRIDEKTIKR